MGSNAEGQGSTKNMRHENSLNDGFECMIHEYMKVHLKMIACLEVIDLSLP